MEDIENLQHLRTIYTTQLEALKQPYDYPPITTGVMGIHLYTPGDPVRRMTPELDEQMRQDLVKTLVNLDEQIARAEKEWAETPKLMLKRPLQGEAAGVFPAGTEFIREDRIFKRPDGVDIGVLMIRGRPYLAVAAAIDKALEE